MITREITREEWAGFFDGFSRMHEGWLATVEVLGAETGAQQEARELPFRGVTAELNEGRVVRVEVMVGAEAEDHITHTVTRPTHVRLAETEAGAHQALEIESEDGLTTLLGFPSPTRPELVDDVASKG